MNNPYQPPADCLVDVAAGRPRGVSILAILTGLLGLTLLGIFLFLLMNWRENNEYFLRQRMAPSVFWVLLGLMVVLSLASSIGMWRGAKWSWWIACSILVMYVVQNLGTAASIAISKGVTDFDTLSLIRLMRSLVLGAVFVLILRYWRSLPVRRYFQFEKAGGSVAILLSGLVGIGIVVAVTVVLQTLFLIRMRQG